MQKLALIAEWSCFRVVLIAEIYCICCIDFPVVHYVIKLLSGPRQAKNCLRTCTKYAHLHPAHAKIIIGAFAFHSNILKYPMIMRADSESLAQTVWMCRLIWLLAFHICQKTFSHRAVFLSSKCWEINLYRFLRWSTDGPWEPLPWSKAVVPVLVLLFVALWFILRGDLFYVLPLRGLFSYFFYGDPFEAIFLF